MIRYYSTLFKSKFIYFWQRSAHVSTIQHSRSGESQENQLKLKVIMLQRGDTAESDVMLAEASRVEESYSLVDMSDVSDSVVG